MCTITYLPLSPSGFILTQSRDESPGRSPAVFPVSEKRHGRELLFPQDPQGGGSWICTDGSERLLCLMNGGTGQHQSQPPYRLSRGQVLLDAAGSSFEDFAQQYSLEGIEPFTLLYIERKENGFSIAELKWNGQLKYTRLHDAGRPHIWSAPQLYTGAQQQARESWFREWLQTSPALKPETALDFHLHGGKEEASHSLLLRREQVKTVSISQAIASEENIQLKYIPLANDLPAVPPIEA